MTGMMQSASRGLRTMGPSLMAFGVLTSAMLGYVSITGDAEHDYAMSRISAAISVCPAIRQPVETLAETRPPTGVDAAGIVSLGRRASARFAGCRGLKRERVPDGALPDDGYWLADRTMEIAEACPSVIGSANDAIDDGRIDVREAIVVMKEARARCPTVDLREKAR